MCHEEFVQGYQKCDMIHVYRVFRNVTEMCTGLSEMGHEASVQGCQKYDMRHVYRVIRNVIRVCAQCYQECDIWDFAQGY